MALDMARLLTLALAVAMVFALPQDLTDSHLTSVSLQTSERYNAAEGLKAQLKVKLDTLTADLDRLEHALDLNDVDVNTEWLLLGAPLVLAMQLGYLLIDVGTVQNFNVQQVLLRSILTITTVGFVWWCVGYGFAFGDNLQNGTRNGFIGNGKIFLSSDKGGFPSAEYAYWVFSAKFVIEATMIATQSMYERARTPAYFIVAVLVSGFLYPVVAHWGWSTSGWISAWTNEGMAHVGKVGLIDLSGGAIVHLFGGFVALAAAYFLGPRKGRFDNTAKFGERYHRSSGYQLSGAFFTWFGFYAFCAVSTLAVSGGLSQYASKIIFNVTLAAAAGALAAHVTAFAFAKETDLFRASNGIIAGLVGVSAGAHVFEPWAATVAGATSAIVYVLGAHLLIHFQIDDPVETVSVHGFAGFWGVQLVGWIARPDEVHTYYGKADAKGGFFYGDNAHQWGVQLLAIAAIVAWALIVGGLLFFVLNYFGLLKASDEAQENGIDNTETVFTPKPTEQTVVTA